MRMQIRAAGGIDLQVLGIGTDGHIGFNEPTSSLASRTRIKTLTRQTRADNARFFGSEEAVPHHVITMGIGTIMEARQNLLLAFGAHKARAVAEAVEGPVTSDQSGVRSCKCIRSSRSVSMSRPRATCNGRTTSAGFTTTSRTGRSSSPGQGDWGLTRLLDFFLSKIRSPCLTP